MTVLQKIILALRNEKQDGDEMSVLTIVHILDSYLPAEEQQIRDAAEAGYNWRRQAGKASKEDIDAYINKLNK